MLLKVRMWVCGVLSSKELKEDVPAHVRVYVYAHVRVMDAVVLFIYFLMYSCAPKQILSP